MSATAGRKASSEAKVKGLLTGKGVKVSDKQSVDELSSKGYGVIEGDGLTLAFYEALYLLDKGLIDVKDEDGNEVSFNGLLKVYENANENAWSKYLTYRDLRSRGYVVREGFGLGVDFRVYERGEYGKDAAKYLILSLQEGKHVTLRELNNVLKQCQGLKKELVLAVMSRRGEVVYYSVSQLALG